MKTLLKSIAFSSLLFFSCQIFGQKTIQENNKKVTITSSNYLIQFNGLYQSVRHNGQQRYLRFYPNETVLSVTSTGEAKDVINWLKEPFEDQGIYEVKKDSIHFTTTSSSGSIVWNGIILNETQIYFESKSLINGHESKETFYFVKL